MPASPQVRSVALVGPGGAGKTQLAEAMLHRAGLTDRLGRVDEGTSILDADPEEQERRHSIGMKTVHIPWRDVRLQWLDVPGGHDFVGELAAGLRAVDGVVLVVDAASGLTVAAERAWRLAEQRGLPRLLFVNRLDREQANWPRTVAALREAFGRTVVPAVWPAGARADGLIPLWEATALARLDGAPAAEARRRREKLVEAVAAADDALLERYLEEGDLDGPALADGLARAVRARALVPVLGGSAWSGAGVDALLDAARDWLPAPGEGSEVADAATGRALPPDPDGPLAALVFKTISDPYVGRISLLRVFSGTLRPDSSVLNVSRGLSERVGPLLILRGRDQVPVSEARPGELVAVTKLQHTATGDTLSDPARPVRLAPIDWPEPVHAVALEPKTKADEDKIAAGLQRLVDEDPTLRVERHPETRQLLLHGLGDLQIDVAVARLRRRYGVEVALARPRVPFRETIRARAEAEYKHKKQTGGRGQYGHVFLRLEPLPRGEGFTFAEEIFGGAVPRQYIPAVEKGVREAMEEGVLAGYPVTDVKVTLYDGSYHSVDSSELAFKLAAAQCFKKAFLDARPVLLEPILLVEVTVPEECTGDVLGDLNRRRGRIQGMDRAGTAAAIRALVPQAELHGYSADLRALTQGRGSFSQRFSHYEEMPDAVARAVIEAAARERRQAVE